uniref:Ectoine hydroxylase n=1 Tax=Candidatus Kentrum sp. DK TaxID=2126562 RepID=A0A450SU60_9GAMM|nr:MAG: ectoine hydroxylase [Candidatus Kentron sp. DK]
MHARIDLYPTREETESIRDRIDPVVFGEKVRQSPFGLESEEVGFYEENGFLTLPEVFSPEEIDLFRKELSNLKKLPELQGREELVREPDSNVVRSIFSQHRFSKVFDDLSRDPRILDKVTQLLGSGAYIHHARINVKAPYYGKSFYWHSDFETWHAEDGIPRCRVVTGWLMLTENNEFNGPLYLIPKSHKRFVSCAGKTPEAHHKKSLRKQEYGVPSPGTIRKLVEEGGSSGATARRAR